jgi:tyrosine-protein kinase Etk/Wzc
MERKTIPRFNQDLEFPLLLYIVKKNILWILSVLILLLVFSFLYLRYTIPHYEASTVIQLTEEESKLDFFDDKKMAGNSNIAQDIELLRSQVFIQRIIDSLPVGVTYYKEGRILDFDNYNAAPYSVDVFQVSNEIYGVPIYIKFNSANTYTLKYKVGKEKFEETFNTGLLQKSRHFSVVIKALDISSCLNPANPSYFVFNNRIQLLSNFESQLKVQVINDAARTIKINFTDVNALRASDVANRMAKEFANFNLERKREGVNNIVAYIDNTLDQYC